MKRIYKTIISAFILTILMMLTLPAYSKADIIIDTSAAPRFESLYYWPEINDFTKDKDPQRSYVICSSLYDEDGIKSLDVNYIYYIPIGYCFNYEINGSDVDTTLYTDLYAYELEDYIEKYSGTSETSIPLFVEYYYYDDPLSYMPEPAEKDLYYWPEINNFIKDKHPLRAYVVCSDYNMDYYIPFGYVLNHEVSGSDKDEKVSGSDKDTKLGTDRLKEYIKKYGGTSENSIPIFVEMTSAKKAQSPFMTTGGIILIILMVIIAVETSILILIKIKKKSTQQVDNIQSVNNKEE